MCYSKPLPFSHPVDTPPSFLQRHNSKASTDIYLFTYNSFSYTVQLEKLQGEVGDKEKILNSLLGNNNNNNTLFSPHNRPFATVGHVTDNF